MDTASLLSNYSANNLKHNWILDNVLNIFKLPFTDLIFLAQQAHRIFFNPNKVQTSTLLSIKTGACPEDCKYCPQSGHYNTGLKKEKLLEVKAVIEEAKKAKAAGATRFCMGAAWKYPPEKEIPYLKKMIRGVKQLGLETCMTLGTLTSHQATALASAGLDYYNHNLDTSKEFYSNIITTRTYTERLQTLSNVRKSGINVCSGGILGMGESLIDRAKMLIQLANMPKHPESVPINMLVKVKGTPLENIEDLDGIEFARTIAVAKIMMPKSYIRLSAGRQQMNDELQSLCFLAGANSIFLGDKLLTTKNPKESQDMQLFKKLGITTFSMLNTTKYPETKTSSIDNSNNKLYYNAMI